jgi:cell division protein ZapE
MSASVLNQYRDLVSLGEIECDPAQLEAAERLDALSQSLRAWRPERTGLMSLLGRRKTDAPRGLYIHGAVGRGKTMLMDLFHGAVAFSPKQRSHFHEFMAEVHERIGEARRAVEGDPIPVVAGEIAAKARLLCFDELHVTDIADAMILGRLFKHLFERGIVVVATSNAGPGELYKNGLNRQLFLPFIDLIEERMDVIELKAAKDFRMDKLAGRPLYFTPADAAARAELDEHWERLTGHHTPAPVELEVKGRRLRVPLAAMGVARFPFAELCEKPLGSLDFLRIAHAFHTLLIDGIPVLGPARRDIARRFVNLIDTLYDNRVCLIASAEAEPGQLYPRGDGADLFQRTASRLMEMRSEAYLEARSARAARATREGGGEM